MAARALGDAVTDEEEPDPPIEPRQVLASGFVVYGVMLLVAFAWLAYRDRSEAWTQLAIGERGPWLGALAGLVVGCALAIGMRQAVRRSSELQRLERLLVRSFDGVGDTAILCFVLSGALAEESLFRLAVQDAFGLPGSVAVHVLSYSCAGGWRWLPFLVPQALLLGLLVQEGFGLFAATAANAIMNHLNLKRLRCDGPGA